MKKIPLWIQIIIACILGGILATLNKPLGVEAKILGDGFIRLIKMTIVPLIFPTIVLGIAQMSSVKQLGRLSFKTLLYFFSVTTLIIIMSVFLANVFKIGEGANLAGVDQANIASYVGKEINFKEFLINIIPQNVIASFAEGNILSVLFFGSIFGVALGSLAGRAKALENLLECQVAVMSKILDYVISLSPIGVFGFIAYSVAAYGWNKIKLLGDLVLVVYIGLAVVIFIIFPIICRIFGVKYFALLAEIKDLLLIATSTRSSESILSPLMKRLENYGSDKSVVSLVLPLGFSFNLDGGMTYFAPAILFLANAYGMDLSVTQQFQVVLLIMLLSKGMAGVAGAQFIVLTSVTAAIGLPSEGIALLFAVDFVMDIARTATNVIGNAVATVVMSKSERMFEPNQNSKHVNG
ncbi:MULTISPECIES: dicarboxylate/amino acid:cation symporter [Bacillus]|uniref:dicarboxylate/amino acid:cation symporter n=1 Tax=Bacillus TaxID=1386 RepID=UPI002DBCCA55|nr:MULTISPECIES: cation:dicarboxylase symporter family transporter [Bacillus]MEC1561970.1 cation:dicarboxylase symporter family transporter [Bacillus haynesii]MEC5228749.1 cation:dicarboxylase symporter family transporter [Bacillus inaquosorum]MED1170728.1 cation:dicarboxylase symporter family transporter [Bacillus inaquosorum]MED1197023.1 cation:dicarboxylase symporter family transporter [Bacillus inaquosorum]MED1226034.1 cation:dicarboxylase symporter family transporter [Bacillus inaquosorum